MYGLSQRPQANLSFANHVSMPKPLNNLFQKFKMVNAPLNLVMKYTLTFGDLLLLLQKVARDITLHSQTIWHAWLTSTYSGLKAMLLKLTKSTKLGAELNLMLISRFFIPIEGENTLIRNSFYIWRNKAPIRNSQCMIHHPKMALQNDVIVQLLNAFKPYCMQVVSWNSFGVRPHAMSCGWRTGLQHRLLKGWHHMRLLLERSLT